MSPGVAWAERDEGLCPTSAWELPRVFVRLPNKRRAWAPPACGGLRLEGWAVLSSATSPIVPAQSSLLALAQAPCGNSAGRPWPVHHLRPTARTRSGVKAECKKPSLDQSASAASPSAASAARHSRRLRASRPPPGSQPTMKRE